MGEGAIVTIVELRGGGMGVVYHMHFAYIVLHNNIMYRYTAIDVFIPRGRYRRGCKLTRIHVKMSKNV